MNSIEGAESPNAMVNEQGDYFYPDGLEDALMFAKDHGAWPVDYAAFVEFLRPWHE